MGESFENLKVWQKAHELMLFVHREVVPLLPKDEKWDLADQIRRSRSLSVLITPLIRILRLRSQRILSGTQCSRRTRWLHRSGCLV